ncbi:tRNA N(3)-methylcytidine methyltransferase METTL6 [Caerostris darwini]|uniref:tRNA N(3)-methylcytidine methyltransferase METTL6 n=1 Tax=Caerostris darwini TaxID=1538125 RepID=A0AAV4VH00_9ARAC|nr:tRNA N(3)-methylcytidine methyltransferase METTL6 [Caerostris darwini]
MLQENSGHYARALSEQEIEKLSKDKVVLSEFKRNKLEIEAKKNWDLFYKRNKTKFFKDRHWTKREFEELANYSSKCNKKPVLLEIGCGVGNFIFPLLSEGTEFFIHACDFSSKAIDLVKVLRPGGMLLMRDYGLYDQAMLRFGPGHKLDEHFYVRQDGTRAFYFSEEYLGKLVTEAGFKIVSNKYVSRETVNHKESICVPRVYIQGKFVKPQLSDFDNTS